MSDIINKYEIFKELKLNKDFIKKFNTFDVFKDIKSSVFIVTNDDKTYASGSNYCGILGFGHEVKVMK